MKIRLFAVAALLSSALAMPAMAQGTVPSQNHVQKRATVHHNSVHHGAMHHRSARHGAMHHAVNHHRMNRARVHYSDRGHWDRHDSGFWPGDVAAGIVGGAIGAAGAIATAPFHAAYAYDDQYYDGGYYDQGYYNSGFGPYGIGYNDGRLSPQYAAANGLACVPGTWVKGADGLNYPCQ